MTNATGNYKESKGSTYTWNRIKAGIDKEIGYFDI